jgi:energy-coupling factor transporter ATP-binding protein EcfA2
MKKNTAKKPNIKFSEIRALEGRQDKGYEELCVQLLHELSGANLSQIDRIEGRGGDGGVEAIASTESGLKIGLQTKFFSKLGASQWTQIDDSVTTAIEKHPELGRYLVCVPLDRTPAQLVKWAQLQARWNLLKPDMAVEWVGLSELMGHLVKPGVSNLLTYWFDCPGFSVDWVSKQTEVAISQLHDRYTPKLHQKTSAENELWLRTASNAAVSNHRKLCSQLVIAWRNTVQEFLEEVRGPGIVGPLERLMQVHQRMLECVEGGDLLKQRLDLADALVDLQRQADSALDALFPESSGPDRQSDREKRREFYRKSELQAALEIAEKMERAIQHHLEAQEQAIWILKGEAGSGKSHLLASLARSILSEKRPCLLLIGERFSSNAVLASQIPSLVDWQWTTRDLLACLSAQASVDGRCAVLMIDAINESPPRGLWRRELQQLVTLVGEFPQVKLIVSCRSDCLDSSIPQGVLTTSNSITHRGFDLDFNAAVQAYFDGYKVVTQQFPNMSSEFQNPLFLKTLCEAFQGKTLPMGPLSFVQVLAEWENRIAEDIERKIDCPRNATKRAVTEIISLLALTGAKRASAELVESVCLRHFPSPLASSSLYRHLNSEGLLQEIETPSGLQVRLQYERFSDVRIAQISLQEVKSKHLWLALWKSSILPRLIVEDSLDWSASSQLFAYALLLPDTADVELVESPISFAIREEWARARAKADIWNAWLDALAWRIIAPNNTKIIHLFLLWANVQQDIRTVLGRLLEFSCVPAHPLNADFLHSRLIAWELSRRETTWTIPLAHENPTDQSGESIVAPFLQWADASSGTASKEQVRLAAVVLLWLTSSPNRQLRKLATDTAIRILVAGGSGDVCLQLLKGFWDVNDPYVKERLLAVIAGVVPYLDSPESTQIANFVFEKFWQHDEVEPHILQRDYAALIVRYACAIGGLSNDHLKMIDRGAIKEKPIVWSEAKVQLYEANPGYSAIKYSLTPEEMGHYGDFGRYEMGSAVHHFVDSSRAANETSGLDRGRGEHDARFARCYIWQRVIELGWTPELYSDFERRLGYSGRGNSYKKVERISKKYQWIGLHEYLGLLSDSLLFNDWNGESRPLRGAWELSVKDYDPDGALRVWDESTDDVDSTDSWWNFENPIIANDTVEEKATWVESAFQPFEPYLSMLHESQRWIVLHTHLNFDEELGFGRERFKSAQMSQWIDVRAFLIPKSKLKAQMKILRGKDFYGEGVDVPGVRQCGISEYPWHPAFAEVDENCRNNETWIRATKLRFFFPVCEISDDAKTVPLPAPTLYHELGDVLRESLSAPRLNSLGEVEISDNSGRIIFKGSTYKDGTFMVDEKSIIQYLKAHEYALVWCVLSEKMAWDGYSHAGGMARQSAVYTLGEDGNISGGHSVFKAEKERE